MLKIPRILITIEISQVLAVTTAQTGGCNHHKNIMTTNDDIAPDIVSRINDAADQLFAEAGRVVFPNVDAVRRRAHVNMNYVTLVMRQWRQQHKPQPPITEESLPETLRHAGSQLLASFWREANAIGQAHLASATSAWEEEKKELEDLQAQLAAAVDGQAAELREASTALTHMRTQLTEAAAVQHRLEQRAVTAESECQGNARVLHQAQQEIQELRSLLRGAQTTQERLTQQLQEQLATHAATTERHMAEQTRYAEQLGQLKEEASQLRQRLADKTVEPSPKAAVQKRAR